MIYEVSILFYNLINNVLLNHSMLYFILDRKIPFILMVRFFNHKKI